MLSEDEDLGPRPQKTPESTAVEKSGPSRRAGDNVAVAGWDHSSVTRVWGKGVGFTLVSVGELTRYETAQKLYSWSCICLRGKHKRPGYGSSECRRERQQRWVGGQDWQARIGNCGALGLTGKRKEGIWLEEGRDPFAWGHAVFAKLTCLGPVWKGVEAQVCNWC